MTAISSHFSHERRSRNALIHEVIGLGNVIDSFVVNRGHVGGAEIHSVTDTAIIVINNYQTNKLITELIARPEQLRRLYRERGEEPPKWLLRRAYHNNRHRYNEV